MAKSLTEPHIGGACSYTKRNADNVSILASPRVWEEGSGHCGKSYKPSVSSKIRVATWNVGTLKTRSAEVLETLSRRKLDICGVQEHRWKVGVAANQARSLIVERDKYRFYYCSKEPGLGGADVRLAEC